MFKAIAERLKQGHRTMVFPPEKAGLPARYPGRPEIDPAKCSEGCTECEDVCPTSAISVTRTGPRLDMGLCLFCTACADACPAGTIKFKGDYRLSARTRDSLCFAGKDFVPTGELEGRVRSILGRSLKLRQVSAGGCNACEADTNVLGTLAFDLGRFGVQFVASPRHADGLLITGPITQNMASALKAAYDATPTPRVVIAVGACAISGGPYADHPEANNGCSAIVPVDLYIPGCPPHPFTILDGLLRLIGRIR